MYFYPYCSYVSSLASYPGIKLVYTDHFYRLPHIGMVEATEFYALHQVRSELCGSDNCGCRDIPRVRIDTYSQGANGTAMQHVFRGHIELDRTIDRQLDDLRAAARCPVLRIFKGPLPLLCGHVDRQGTV